MSIQVCPRCSKQIAGWVTNENGFRSCLMCGFILNDPGFKATSFKALFSKYQASVNRRIVKRESNLVILWKQGVSVTELARQYNKSPHTIRKLLK